MAVSFAGRTGRPRRASEALRPSPVGRRPERQGYAARAHAPLRDVLARALFARYQPEPGRLARILGVYEPSSNRIAVTVAVGFVEERERVIRRQQEAIRATTASRGTRRPRRANGRPSS
jgi:hypothetical protein